MKAQYRKIYFANDSKTYRLKVECHCYVERKKIHDLECTGYKLCYCYVERGEKITSYTKKTPHFTLLCIVIIVMKAQHRNVLQ